MAGRIKKKHRSLADLSAAYGLPHRVTPEQRVGLWLNLDRTMFRKTASHLMAITASKADVVPEHIFVATSDTPEEGKAIFNTHEALSRMNR